MNDSGNDTGEQTFDPAAGLLPAGLRDVLPPEAGWEAAVTERLLAQFALWGYQRIKPPLIEFEETMLAGSGQALAPQMFRLMDPVSQRMLGLRTDNTLQVARIAAHRLRQAPRPLRLSYAGQVLRVRGSQLRPARQFAQAGVELIGPEAAAADTEIVLLAAEALTDLGVKQLSIDLTHPRLVPTICAELGLDAGAAEAARLALDRKDSAALAKIAGRTAAVLGELLTVSGAADKVLADLAGLKLPRQARVMVDQLKALVAEVQAATPRLLLTVDPCEFRGFEYHTGISFTLFAQGVRGELGAGGRYLAGPAPNGGREPATGFTIYLDSLMRALPAAAPGPMVFLPPGTSRAVARHLRAEGWTALQSLNEAENSVAEARRLGCSHVWRDGKIEPLGS